MAGIRPPIRGLIPVAAGQFEINSFTNENIAHGWLRTVAEKNAASFLRFHSLDDATNVHNNLSRIRGDSFLRSHFVITDESPGDATNNVPGGDNSLMSDSVILEENPDVPGGDNSLMSDSVNDGESPCDATNNGPGGDNSIMSDSVINGETPAEATQETYYWVAVDKIDSSLHSHRSSNQLWEVSTRLRPKCQDIIRDIIKGMCLLHQQNFNHGDLSIEHIMIVDDRAKLAFIRNNSPRPDSDFINLETIFRQLLGDENYVETEHFMKSTASVSDWRNLRKLYFHPLLMSSVERFLLPLTTATRLHYRKQGFSHQHMRAFNISCTPQYEWMPKVEEQARYQKVIGSNKKQPKYIEDGYSLLRFVRNAIVHINEKTNSTKSEEEVEVELSSMFPDLLARLYNFFDLMEITPQLHIEHFSEERNVS